MISITRSPAPPPAIGSRIPPPPPPPPRTITLSLCSRPSQRIGLSHRRRPRARGERPPFDAGARRTASCVEAGAPPPPCTSLRPRRRGAFVTKVRVARHDG